MKSIIADLAKTRAEYRLLMTYAAAMYAGSFANGSIADPGVLVSYKFIEDCHKVLAEYRELPE